jgi:hypothetical protein
MALCSLDLLLGAIVAALSSPTPVVFTDWLSTMPALGSMFRPIRSTRRRSRSAACSFSQVVPSMHQRFEVVVDGLRGWEVTPKQALGAAALEDIEDGVEKPVAGVVDLRATDGFGSRQYGSR